MEDRRDVRRKHRDRHRAINWEEAMWGAAELTVDSLSSEMRKADSGTWDTSVGLPELMRESIFSASLLQASIYKNKFLIIFHNLAYV